MWIFLNDRFVKREDALISVFDHGFLYGDGVYETIRSYGDRLYMEQEHILRLFRSAESIGLSIPIPPEHWPELLHEAMIRNDVGHARQDAYLRITVTRGAGEIGLDPALCPSPTVVIMAKPLLPPNESLYATGVELIVASTRRNLPGALSPQIKAISFLNNILAKREAIAAGVFDGILLNWEHHLTECTTSNLFFVTDGCLHTPALECGLLEGITRAAVLHLAKAQRIPIEEGRFTSAHLYQADECFVTNTTMEVMPVVMVDRRQIGEGKPGPITRALRELFRASRGGFQNTTEP